MRTKDLVYIAMYTALIIAAQFALSFAAGVELVTVLVAAFCYSFGVRRGIVLVNSFCALRCVLFGFFPTAVILYAVYYNAFAVVFALIGKAHRRRQSAAALFNAVSAATVMTAAFTLLDDLITPLYFGYNAEAANAYFYSSLFTMGLQCVCAAASVAALFLPLTAVLNKCVRSTSGGVPLARRVMQ